MDDEQPHTFAAAAHSHTDPDHDHDHGHHHGHGGETESPRTLALVAAINLLGFVGELAGGLAFGSIALVSDAVHMLFDALAYVMAFAAAYTAANYDLTNRWSFGLHRLEPLAAFANGALLIPMVGYILWEASHRMLSPLTIDTTATLAIAGGGLAINAVSVAVLAGDDLSLNERGALYHLLGDAGGSVAVITSVVVVDVTGWYWVDPVVAGLIALLVVWSAGALLRGSGAIFLHRSPVAVDEVEAALETIDDVQAVTDLHVWQICSELTIATAHLDTSADTLDAATAVTAEAHAVLAAHDVHHATVELHPADADARLTAHSH